MNKANTCKAQAKIDYALSLGEGVNVRGSEKGFYRDMTRGG